MPTVPRYNQPTVETTARPNIQRSGELPLDAFGGGASAKGVTDAVGKIGQVGMEIAAQQLKYEAEERRKADEVRVLNADYQTALKQSAREQQLTQYKGDKAAEAPTKILPDWEKDVSDIRSSLSNDNQKLAYDQRVMARNLRLNEMLNRHVSTELQKFDEETTEAFVINEQADAARNAYEPGLIKTALERQVGIIKMHANRISEPPQVTDKKIRLAVQQTALGVIDQVIADGEWDVAETYLKDYKSFLTGDQERESKSLIELGRKKAIDKKKENNSELERELYLQVLPDKDGKPGPLGLKEIHGLLSVGTIDVPFYEKLRSRIVKVNDDPEIPTVEKNSKLFEILKKYDDLNGTSVDMAAQKVKGRSKGNRLNELQEFRSLVAENASYLTRKQEESFYKLTQKDFDDAVSGKIGLFRGLINYLSDSISKNAGAVGPITGPIVSQVMDAFDPKVPIEKAAETAARLKTEATIAINPNRAKYQVGQVLAAGSEIDFNGKKISLPSAMTVIGFDDDGTPLIDPGVIKVKQ